jgi:hypothetical protein
LARSAVYFWLTILAVTLLGIYFRGYKAKKPGLRHKGWAHGIQQTADGGYAIGGVLWRAGGGQSYLYLVKTDALGRKAWSSTFKKGDVNRANALGQTAEGGYILAGTTWSSGGRSDIYLLKTDNEGRRLWSAVYGGKGKEEGHGVRQTADGGFVVCGHTDSLGQGKDDVFLMKIDEHGKEIWQRTYGGRGKDQAFSVGLTLEGGYIICGLTDSFGQGSEDVYLIKTDNLGKRVWSKTFGGRGRDWGKRVGQDPDGGYILAGTTWPAGQSHCDIYLIKTDAEGRKLWDKTLGTRYGDYAYALEESLDGGYVVAGNTWPAGSLGESKVYLVKTDGRGEMAWARTLGGPGSQYGRAVAKTLNGGYIVAGKISRGGGDEEIYLVKTNPDGTKAWSTTLGE